MSAFFSDGRVVHAVAGHRHDLPVGLDRLHQPQLVLGAGAREDVDVAHRLLQRRLVHLLDLGAGDRGLAVADAEHLGDGRGGDLVVAGDHGDADAAVVALLHRLDGLLARRIEQADQAEQDQVLRQIGRAQAAGRETGILEPGQRQHALALGRELVRDPLEVLAVERRRRAGRRLLAVAVAEDDLGRALDEQDLPAVGRAVQRRHELVLGLERDGVDARLGVRSAWRSMPSLVAKG